MACIPNNYLQEYTGSDSSATGIIQTPAFSLQGAAIGYIFPMTGISKFVTIPGSSQYKQVLFTAPNILSGPDYISNTTLLHNGKNYRLEFIAIHANVWASSPIQVSMVFTNGLEIFHIAIPIQFDSTFSTHSENAFLKWWIYANPEGPRPSSLSVNDLLMFDGTNTSAAFDFYSFCVKYDSAVNPIHTYNFCNFKTPLYVNSGQLPAWLSSDPTMQQMDGNGFYETSNPGPNGVVAGPTYMKSFNSIFNVMFQGTQFFSGLPDVNPISSRAFFTMGGNPTGVKPSKFLVRVSLLAYKTPTTQAERKLQNVKCYPIDLASQVDENGNIYIDESTKKPIDMSNLTSPALPTSANNDVAFQNKVLYWVIYSVIGLIALAIIVALVIWMFTTKETGIPPDVVDLMNSGSTAPPPASVAPAAAAAAPVAAAAASSLTALPENPFNLFNNKSPTATPTPTAQPNLTAAAQPNLTPTAQPNLTPTAQANLTASPVAPAQAPLPENPFNLFNNKVAQPNLTPAAKGLNARLNAGISPAPTLTPRFAQPNAAKMNNTLPRVPLLRQTGQVNTSSIHQ